MILDRPSGDWLIMAIATDFNGVIRGHDAALPSPTE